MVVREVERAPDRLNFRGRHAVQEFLLLGFIHVLELVGALVEVFALLMLKAVARAWAVLRDVFLQRIGLGPRSVRVP